jgi:predicted RNA-binding Zn ribbon-like protein
MAGVATIRWRLVETAVALLTSDRLARLSACPSCGWFFLDASKNRSRRWCSMAMCGSAAKARSYYWRTKKGAQHGLAVVGRQG